MFGRFLKTPPLAADQPYCPLEGLPSRSLAAAEAHDSLLLFLKQPAHFPLAHLHFSALDFSAISLSKECWVSVVLCVCDCDKMIANAVEFYCTTVSTEAI